MALTLLAPGELLAQEWAEKMFNKLEHDFGTVARGAETVFRFSEGLESLSQPVLMAGQVLEHMVEQSAPTRSELCYLHDTLLKGYQGFVLSDETAIGRYPVESCRTAALFRT